MEAGTVTEHTIQSNPSPASGPLVQVTFQKDPNRAKKYLESEPKALGCTQILLAVFFINFGVLDEEIWTCITECIVGIFPIIAGCVAIAAQNLSLPRLKACLGLQVFTTITCAITFLMTTIEHVDSRSHPCGYRLFENDTHMESAFINDACLMLWTAQQHYCAEAKLVLATIIAISATLSAYCCKVIKCCSPGGLTPVIIVNAPPAPASGEDRGESPNNG